MYIRFPFMWIHYPNSFSLSCVDSFDSLSDTHSDLNTSTVITFSPTNFLSSSLSYTGILRGLVSNSLRGQEGTRTKSDWCPLQWFQLVDL